MKKIYSFFILLLFLNIAKAQFPSPYCSEVYSSGVEPITLVVLDSINNASPAAISVSGTEDHEDFTSLSTTLVQGSSHTITVKGNTDGSFYSDYITVFIDWNQNGDFTDVGERYDIGIIKGSTGLDNIKVTGTINVPINAMTGSTRMRVAKHYNTYQDPCLTNGFDYGQAEDYTLNITASPNCSGTPPATVAHGPSSSCTDSLINLYLTGITAGTGLTYQWQCSKDTISWNDIPSANDASSMVTLVDTCNKFRCKVTCTSSMQFSYSSIVVVTPLDCGTPPNDEACDAITLYLDSTADCRNTTYATSVSDPTFNCSSPNNTTWYKYTPTVTGPVQFTLSVPNINPLNGWLGVYTASGSCPGGLTFSDSTTAVLGTCKSFGSTVGETKFLANLNAGTEYYFMIDGVVGAYGNYCISIQTPPPPPATCATNIKPSNGAIDLPITNVVLKWTTVPGATSYKVYGGTTNPPTSLITTVTTDSVVITGMAYSTTYYWYVSPTNSGGSAVGCDATATSFTTVAAPPPPSCTSNILPADAAIDVTAPSTQLKWNAVSGATGYSVYFGTTNPPTTTVTTNITDTFYNVGGLSFSTDYYWYVVPKNGGGSATGCDANTTMFTTMAVPPPPNNDECDSAVLVTYGTSTNGTTVSATQSLTAILCSGFTGTADDDVWFKFTTSQAGNVDIKLVPLGNLDAVVVAYSGDCSSLNYIGCADTSVGGGTEIVHLTALNANETYLFRVYGYGSTLASQGAFTLTINGTALPVNLTKFSGYKDGSVNLLQWTTLTESNNKGFNVEKSADGKNFITVNFVESKSVNGNSAKELNYQYTDNNPFADATYYRLKQTDKNGKFTYSNIINIKGNKISTTTITDVYPNPVNSVLNIVIASPKEEKISIAITDVTGRVVKTYNININQGNTVTSLDASSLQKGMYFIKAISSNNVELNTSKFIKQ